MSAQGWVSSVRDAFPLVAGDDEYLAYVVAAYALSAVILGALIWASVAAARRARSDLDGLERERRR